MIMICLYHPHLYFRFKIHNTNHTYSF
uniref:Uncharacterized protein n=1 Tax=Rhizophora mucronata TaxID=61149 RepID=A0A2P2QZJ4_RHIMU